ncbi:hypothetical protein EJ02DRAFT_398438 [Clathrospora elynae]|uniref:PHD-type domain-containing protein n=1 Tax=Clathrospora elynae TaxID=706981 RepID=A0A6A5SVR2_9PLEO|nr:hypothetical protein EJ02DRAFT_398438 [Clathrospora elynae]
MVSSLMFRWEDSQALKHHCGFCERPLSHPGARASCFGKHSEPCVRFHQAMFMRLRAHTCRYCQDIDEAHYKRHHEIAEQLRGVYESYGEVDWSIIPSEPEAEVRGRAREPGDSLVDSGEPDSSLMPDDTPSSKRERKDAKRLARAASRSRVITQDEIRYIDSILHSAEGISSSDTDGPRNPEEVEEIERQLRYHAQVYNTQPNRTGLKRFAEVPDDVDVDFDAEMERILDIFRISELLKRNTKTKGMQGKELKMFLALVDVFKQAIVEDIVQVKKDAVEVRMRRAGYLRYTNKTSYGIVEDRYTDKNWKTGEKFASSASDSSDAITLVEDLNVHASKQYENQSPRPLPTTHGPDLRHLKNNYTRVDGDDGIYESIIEPYRAPLLPMLPNSTPSKKTTSLKVVSIKAPDPGSVETRGVFGKKTSPRPDPDGWQRVANGAAPTVPIFKGPAWGNIPKLRPSEDIRPLPTPSSDASDFPDLSSSRRGSSNDVNTKAPAVRSLPAYASNEPEGFVAEMPEPTNGHPAVSQKKKAKKAREAKRKAKKFSSEEEDEHTPAVQHDAADKPINEIDTASMNSPTTPVADAVYEDDINSLDIPEALPLHWGEVDDDFDINAVADADVLISKPYEKPSPTPPTALVPVTKSGKHMHWLRFTRNFIVDQLTDPCLATWVGCAHGTSCAFEHNNVPDCPFHEPHCSCVDPMADLCYLVIPCAELCSSGPYNRLRGEKLLAQYDKDSRTKGRLMLVDDDLVNYFMEDPTARARNRNPGAVPGRLAREYSDYAEGYNPGPLMEQERQFERLWNRNKIIKQQISQELLQNIQHHQLEVAGTAYMCYCRATAPKQDPLGKDVIMCSHRDCPITYFHKSCVKKLGAEKVSRWLCTSCEKEMRVLACQTLRGLGYTDIPDEDYVQELNDNFETYFDRLMNMSQKEFEKVMPKDLSVRVNKMGGLGAIPDELKDQLREMVREMADAKVKSVRVLGIDLR